MQTIFQQDGIAGDFPAGYHVYALVICRSPGITQDAIAKDICVNKSTVTRRLDWLETEGYVVRCADECDKRRTLVYPTDKMIDVQKSVKKIAKEWKGILTEGISEEELAVFESVITRMEEHGKAVVFKEVLQ